ncbi:hypothetical protein CNMCM8927_006799 [Aspergillus lentulus]|uniref:Uncharacterized protein n=1 Tax=Aspergillus lentulus TaxID=293939 RepID=A0AAN5YW10_ASPLE|nr:hypothetical protein CNMCM6069_005142 [Aspergillus lentulus]KAF4183059.1 hypothetical protein CNMCM8060_005086 [Aspergillus lentulus]KAF4190411.1 hypothetical protein CNMCM7927_003381 [Aspergillus lentulus]KAF4199374.1 hypothetical protein CNMCM8694_005047 [Aspergillus lentulus]KAF4209359.1 hypothetical protein CNMCM8927_006799 [Aspergillus lentulus]
MEHPKFIARVQLTLTAIKGCIMTKAWKQRLHNEWSDDDILMNIYKYTLPSVRDLLNDENPPSYDSLLALEWVETLHMGVYIKLIYPKTGTDRHVYVGSATSQFGGLASRRETHERPVRPGETSYHRNLLLAQPKPIVKFCTLFQMPQGLSSKDANHTRRLCILAEAIYCSLLGGYMSRVSYELRNACPFGFPTSVFNWHGACSHTCLTEGQRDHWTISDAALDEIIQATSTETLEDSELRVALRRTRNKLATRLKRAKYRESEEAYARYLARNREYMREYRRIHYDELHKHDAELPEHVKAARRCRKKVQMRGYRARNALLNPKPKHIVPAKNRVRNDQRKILRASDPLQKMKAKLQMRVSRARQEYRKQTTQVGQATAEVRLAVAEVKRFKFNQKQGIALKDIPSARSFELAQTVDDSSDDNSDADLRTGSRVLDLEEHVMIKNEPESRDDAPYQSGYFCDDESSDAGPDADTKADTEADSEADSEEFDFDEYVTIKDDLEPYDDFSYQSEYFSDDESTDAGPDSDIETDSGEFELEEHVIIKEDPESHDNPPYKSEHFSDVANDGTTTGTDVKTDSGEFDLEEHVMMRNVPPKPPSPSAPLRQLPMLKRQNTPRLPPRPKRAKKTTFHKPPTTVNPWTIAKGAGK